MHFVLILWIWISWAITGYINAEMSGSMLYFRSELEVT